LYYGGGSLEGESSSWSDLELEIEAFSMERTDPDIEQARMMQMWQIVTQTLPLSIQFPWFPWRKMFEGIGDQMNMDDLVDEIDWQGYQQHAELMMQGQQLSLVNTAEGGEARKPGYSGPQAMVTQPSVPGLQMGAMQAQGALGGLNGNL